MSDSEETTSPVMTGETGVTAPLTMVPVDHQPNERTELEEQLLEPFSGARARVKTVKLVADALRREVRACQPELQPLQQQVLPPLWRVPALPAQGPDEQVADWQPHDAHCPAKLLDTTFEGTPEKLAFFAVRAQKFVMNWGHLFPDDGRRMDYITSQLRDSTVDWYVGFHNADGLELPTVDAFMWTLRVQYEDPNSSKQVHAYLYTFKQGKKLVHEYSDGQMLPALAKVLWVLQRRVLRTHGQTPRQWKLTQQALQVSLPEGDPESSEEEEDETVGKGQDLE
ncbi:UNVERIFIED_CONTAM: hypothetical protein K2H54_049345 [Gekko kuhli]